MLKFWCWDCFRQMSNHHLNVFNSKWKQKRAGRYKEGKGNFVNEWDSRDSLSPQLLNVCFWARQKKGSINAFLDESSEPSCLRWITHSHYHFQLCECWSLSCLAPGGLWQLHPCKEMNWGLWKCAFVLIVLCIAVRTRWYTLQIGVKTTAIIPIWTVLYVCAHKKLQESYGNWRMRGIRFILCQE